jgi:hypothetical protein
MEHRLRSARFVISPDIMNTVTTADLRDHFRRVSAWLDNGESVEILKRGKPYATLLRLLSRLWHGRLGLILPLSERPYGKGEGSVRLK